MATAVEAVPATVKRKDDAAASDAASLDEEVVERWGRVSLLKGANGSRDGLRSLFAPESCGHCQPYARSAGLNVPTLCRLGGFDNPKRDAVDVMKGKG